MEVGERVPDVALRLDDGTETRLYPLLEDGPLVVFFYPKAFTPGCTAQACHFRDLGAEFAEFGANRIGVSRDDAGTQHGFREKHGFDFPLVADPDGAVADVFGAKRLGPLPSKRSTYVLAEDGTLLEVIASETDMQVHADRALAALREHRATA